MNSIKVALAIAVCSILAWPASADMISGRKVTSTDAGGTSFNDVNKRKFGTPRTTGETASRAGEKTDPLMGLLLGIGF